MPIKGALNLEAFAVQSPTSFPPPMNSLYLRDGVYDSMTREDVAKTFAAFRAQTVTNRLALFFHGGLVDKVSGQQSAANEFAAYQNDAFPLFFIWESGFGEVLAHHLPQIFAETIFGRVLSHASDIIGPKVAARPSALEAVAAAPIVTNEDIDAFIQAVQSDPLVQNEAVAIARSSQDINSALAEGVTTEAMKLSPLTMLSPEVVSSVRGAFLQANPTLDTSAQSLESFPFTLGGALQAAYAIAKAAVPIILNTIKRFAKGRDHGLQCTVVEEILRALYLANFGSAIWEEMKKETEDAFGSDSTKFGGTAVIEEICQLVKNRPATTISLVGHSTGGVYIGNFLQHVDQSLRAQGDATTMFDIILLAPANTDDFLAKTYVRSRINGIRIFQMKDEIEQQDHLLSKDVGPEDPSILGKIYPRSLLYLVSGVCEYFEGQGSGGVHQLDSSDMPILGMERFHNNDATFRAADYPQVEYVRQLFSEVPATTAFARVVSPTDKSAPPGFRSGALKHGNFPGDAATIESLRFCFQRGLLTSPQD
jgi:hypothetical protein